MASRLRIRPVALALALTISGGLVGELGADPQRGAASIAPVREQRGTQVNLKSTLEPIRAQHELPALAGLIIVGGKIRGVGATGVRKRGSGIPVTVNDRWVLGSCTQAMSATLIARLIEQGQLGWNTRLQEALPALADTMHPLYRGATLEQLLSHRSGAPENPSAYLENAIRRRARKPSAQREMLVEMLLSLPPDAPPGKVYGYSNAGLMVAGRVAEQAAGASWEQLMTQEVFEPLGMYAAGFGAPGPPAPLDDPWGHDESGAPVAPGLDDNERAVLGPVHATLLDWARFAIAHLAGARGASGYLKVGSFVHLHRAPPGQGQALGWGVSQHDWAGGRALAQRGSGPDWDSQVWLAPRRNLAVLITTNQGGERAGQALQDAASALIEIAQRLARHGS